MFRALIIACTCPYKINTISILNSKVTNGVCWTQDGFLVVAEHNRVLNFPAAEFFYEGPDVAVIEVVPQGKLIPTEHESYNHGARTCRVGPDGKFDVTLGQPLNVQPRDKVDEFNRLGIGGIVRMDPFDGSGSEVYSIGMRNSVGQDFNPKDGSLWWTDNQTDGLGNEVPPGELIRSTKKGEHFGYPFWNGKFKKQSVFRRWVWHWPSARAWLFRPKLQMPKRVRSRRACA